jgi:hypothetical protein
MQALQKVALIMFLLVVIAIILFLAVNSSKVVAATEYQNHWGKTHHDATDLKLLVVYITAENKWIISRSDFSGKPRRGGKFAHFRDGGFAKRALHLPHNTWHEVLIDASQPRRILAFNYNPFPEKQKLVEQIFPSSLANLIFEYVVRKI